MIQLQNQSNELVWSCYLIDNFTLPKDTKWVLRLLIFNIKTNERTRSQSTLQSKTITIQIENLISEIDKKPKSPRKNKTLRQSANQSRLSANQSRVAPPTNILPPNQSVAQSDPVTQQLSYAYLNT